jgi:hypothetical protein
MAAIGLTDGPLLVCGANAGAECFGRGTEVKLVDELLVSKEVLSRGPQFCIFPSSFFASVNPMVVPTSSLLRT